MGRGCISPGDLGTGTCHGLGGGHRPAGGWWLLTKYANDYLPMSLADVDARWQLHQRAVAQALGATLVIARDAGPLVHIDAPALVSYIFEQVVLACRNGRSVRPDLDASALSAVGGRLASNPADDQTHAEAATSRES